MRILLLTSLLMIMFSSLSLGLGCYLTIEESGDYNPKAISEFAIPVISQYVEHLSPIPPSGISANACQYQLSISESRTALSITKKKKNMNAYGDSNQLGMNGVREAILRAIYRTKPERKSEICRVYSSFLVDCGSKLGVGP
ncbi:MAG: hypothetical protein GY786_17420, partial [Proteobacteria bacterium]|nr:hypothetical protein [Pseudomonadota bacterium]